MKLEVGSNLVWDRKGKEGGEAEGRDLNMKGKEGRKMRCWRTEGKEAEEMGDEKGAL